MNLLHLEEAQGLTAQKMRAYLERKGWRLIMLDGTKCYWVAPSGKQSHVMRDGWAWWMDSILGMVAEEEKRSAQAVLREMNPRFQVGIPSEVARAAHPGQWMAKTLTGGLLIGTWKLDPLFGLMLDCFGAILQAKAEWSYWPVDEQGARMPWPEKDRVML